MTINIERLNNIPLCEILSKIIQANPNYDGISDKWKLPNGDVIQIRKNQWHNWNKSISGYGAVSLVQSWLNPSVNENNDKSEAIHILTKYLLSLDLEQELYTKQLTSKHKI